MRHFRFLFVGALVDSIGTGVSAFALAVYMFGRYESVTAVAAVQLCAFTPLVVLAPIAGTLADRFDRRILMMIGDGGSIGGLALVAWTVSTPDPSMVLILGGIAASSTLASLTEPALQASVSELVPDGEYVRASGLLQLASSSKFLISPLLGGWLLWASSVQIALFLDMATCLVTVACTLVVRGEVGAMRVARSTGFLSDLLSGWRIMTGTRAVRNTVAVVTGLAFTLGIVQVLLRPILLAENSVATAGVAETVAACGLIAGAALVSMLHRAQPVRLLTCGIAAAGIGMLLVPCNTAVWWISAAAFIIFAALTFCTAGAEVIVRRRIAVEEQGRAWGTIGLVSQLGFVFAYVAAGPLADGVFAPLLQGAGPLATTLGTVVGTTPGRSSALLVGCMGLIALALAPVAFRALKDA